MSLVHKMKYLTAQFQLCFCFCIGNTIGILADNLLVATYPLSCLSILVPNAVAE